MKRPPGLDELRKRIDSVDSRILDLLEERASIAKAIGDVKRKGKNPSFFDPEREVRVLERLREMAQGDFPERSIGFVFKEIMSACRSLEASYKVAYLGPAGSYSQIAAHQAFGQSVEYLEVQTIESVFDAVERKNADYGIVPFENSSGGGVSQTLDSLTRTDLQIRGETFVKIDHCLMTRDPSRDFSKIRRVYSHPQALMQCKRWLLANIPRAEQIASKSTSAAAEAAANDPDAAAISSKLAAERLGLQILRESIQDYAENATRFVVLHAGDGPRTGRDRTTLVLAADNPALVFSLFQKEKARVLRAETLPNPKEMWGLHYFVDLQGHRTDPKLNKILRKVKSACDSFKILGSYPSDADH